MAKQSLTSMNRRGFLVAGAAAAGTVSMPWVAGAQAKVIKVAFPTILSGRVA